ncbi:hypothetical protein I7I51_03249 [Histoplasma capsulatum]|uniref:Uncharacterized protein n=1 Tax=Ajellomyces capsulatus TaxID=5037 RepID=A0A8A1MA70_AJECA|nr:hypothetical protein I7I51_03249 [Histoplasma capsulatum]
MAADLELFRQNLTIDRYLMMLRHSHGGTIVLASAEMFPRHIAKLVLTDHRLLGHDDSTALMRHREEREGDVRFELAYHTPRTDFPTSDEEVKEFMIRIIPIYFLIPKLIYLDIWRR